MKDFYKYKAYYCGLCKVLREKHGFLGQLTLTYDMTFLVILLHSLYESDMNFEEHRCVVHPAKKQKILYNEITEYAADMNIVLTYFHFVDDWKDEKSKAGLVGVRAFRKTYLEIEKKYPKKCRIIRSCLKKLQACEEQKEECIVPNPGYINRGICFILHQMNKVISNSRMKRLESSLRAQGIKRTLRKCS